MLPFFLMAMTDAPRPPEPPPPVAAAASPEFSVVVPTIARSAHGVQVGMVIANLPGAARVFAHLEPYAADPRGVMYVPPATTANRPSHDRSTYFLTTGGSRQVVATLLFDLEPQCPTAVLVVGETVEPYRQTAISLDLGQASAAETPAPQSLEAPAIATPQEPVIASFKPPSVTLGNRVVLHAGSSGPSGHGWARIYTDLPEISLDTLTQAIEKPHQVWGGSGGFAYLLRLDAARAIAIEVANGEVLRARMLNKASFEHFVGVGSAYPQRLYASGH